MYNNHSGWAIVIFILSYCFSFFFNLLIQPDCSAFDPNQIISQTKNVLDAKKAVEITGRLVFSETYGKFGVSTFTYSINYPNSNCFETLWGKFRFLYLSPKQFFYESDSNFKHRVQIGKEKGREWSARRPNEFREWSIATDSVYLVRSSTFIQLGSFFYRVIPPHFFETFFSVTNYSLLGIESISGKPCFVIQATSDNFQDEFVVWIDCHSFVPRKIEESLYEVKRDYCSMGTNFRVFDFSRLMMVSRRYFAIYVDSFQELEPDVIMKELENWERRPNLKD